MGDAGRKVEAAIIPIESPASPKSDAGYTVALGYVVWEGILAKQGVDFERGWDAAILAARQWHEGKAKQALVQAGRARFPKKFEQEAEVHTRCAEQLAALSPDDV